MGMGAVASREDVEVSWVRWGPADGREDEREEWYRAGATAVGNGGPIEMDRGADAMEMERSWMRWYWRSSVQLGGVVPQNGEDLSPLFFSPDGRGYHPR